LWASLSTREGDIARYTQLDAQFHLMLAERFGNGEIVRVMGRCKGLGCSAERRRSAEHPRPFSRHRAYIRVLISGESRPTRRSALGVQAPPRTRKPSR